jgi:hypothetical protein
MMEKYDIAVLLTKSKTIPLTSQHHYNTILRILNALVYNLVNLEFLLALEPWCHGVL